ncbi:putative sulfate/molybdate transporter [Natronosalvus rutilus]|uniref:Sulfate/molybdate transporter n=1 Tax=Natronosalvus rutilus TaxID=2953753 RepID=A0A9E7NBW6_9EURY|nr:putative sulfate/molybdate transporter [Natronosalvus rutilus]UTF54139.1 putative sulfate/molybdate transporter [Natronosalvus rutilus]
MAVRARHSRLEFTSNEVTGAIGDSITVLPLVVALALVTSISLPHVMIAFGVFQIVWGLRYGLPISVEPMKALAALAIAGAMTYGEIALAGLLLGVVLLAIGVTGTLASVERWIGEPVIRGVQFAVGLLLLETGVHLALEDVVLAGVGVAIVAAAVVLGYRRSSALVVLIVGLGLALAVAGVPSPRWPGPPPVPPLGESVSRAVLDGAFAQLAMTIGNAALATSLLVADLFDETVSPDELATSMGATNLLAIPAGGIPMCHGCDGVAGKYTFGARSGGANVILGGFYLAAAVFASATLLEAFPLAMLGVLLVVVAVTLGSSVRQSEHLLLSVGIGLLALATNIGLAFVVGIVAHLGYRRVSNED